MKSSKSPISHDEDAPLTESCFSTGILPLWLKVSTTTSDEFVLEDIRTKRLNKCDSLEVTLLYNGIEMIQSRISKLKDWCQGNDWKCIERKQMTGSEAPVVVLYDIATADLEDYSRAQKQLIIVTR